jgi:hypothetical protein
VGTDIWGWIEVGTVRDSRSWLEDLGDGIFRLATEPAAAPFVEWRALVHIDGVTPRYYDMFGLLFGVRNYVGFPPVVPLRGLPADISAEALEDRGEEAWSDESWILWSEIRDVDWDVSVVDRRVHIFKRMPDGSLGPADVTAVTSEWEPPPGLAQVEGAEWERDGHVYRVVRVSRREVLEARTEWPLLFDLMARLAKDYGDDLVRMVVWFSG